MTLADWILIAVPARIPAHYKDLREGALLEGFNPMSVGSGMLYHSKVGRLVRLAPGLYRRPTNHEAKP